MRLLVVSHKVCWPSATSSSGYATDGGFPLQMRALASLFDHTVVCVPMRRNGDREGEVALASERMSVVALPMPGGTGIWRKLLFPIWIARALPALVRAMRSCDAVHAPIPGDVGTVGIALAHVARRPLFVRHCGNWNEPRTTAERLWRAYMVRFANDLRVMMATGGGDSPPSDANAAVEWIFSTTLSRVELESLGRERDLDLPNLRLVIVCRQEEAKGVGRAIEALALLAPTLPDATLEVIGSGPALATFRALADHEGVGHRVTFTGQLGHDDVLARVSQCDLFVFPTSASEGFPKAPLEAMACGVPVAATAVSVLPHLLADGGVVLDDATPAALAAAIRLIIEDPDRYRSLSHGALRTARAYSLDEWASLIGERLERRWHRPLR